MTKPSPDFIASLIAIMLIGIAVVFVVTIHNYKERKLDQPMCVSEFGKNRVECP